MDCPDFLIIGHICKDLLEEGFTLGGTVAYSGLTARNLGRRVGVVTSYSPEDLDVERFLPGIEIVCSPSLTTTTFRNIYNKDGRHQFLYSVANRITKSDIPPLWRECPIVLLGPLAQEIDEEVVRLFPNSLIGVTPQGWMRGWNGNGRVYTRIWTGAHKVLPWARVLVLSEEDVGGDLSLIEPFVEQTEIVVVTKGWKGSTVYYRGGKHSFPAPPVEEVDPTGAGDIYTAAYLVRLEETNDPFEAARFANCVASYSVLKRGIEGVPTPRQIKSCY
ncbi:MAG: PfkB family carbohydrate kinase [Anaerolineae bacterium]